MYILVSMLYVENTCVEDDLISCMSFSNALKNNIHIIYVNIHFKS